jgi:large subunit ribosomal protein L4
MSEVNLYNSKGETVGKIQMGVDIFGGKINRALLHEVTLMYLANQRQGTACTKTKGEVSGGGIKPWKQKGTGRARAGSIRSPLWRHGGTIFGPKPRDYSYSMPAKKKKLALQSALKTKLTEAKIIVLESIDMSEQKTRALDKIFAKLNANTKTLLVVKKVDEQLKRFSRNIPYLNIAEAQSLNAYDVLNCQDLVVVKEAIGSLEEMFKA